MSSEQQEEINSLRETVNELKRRSDAEDKSLLKKWSGVLALIAAIFAVPQGIIGLYSGINSLFTRPNTSISISPPLTMSYIPEQKSLSFEFNLAMANNGSQSDTIKEASARLVNPSAPSSPVSFSSTDFKLTSSASSLSFPFTLGKDATKDLSVSVNSNLGEVSSNTLLQTGMRQLIIEFKGDSNKTYSQKFCFHLTQGIIDDVFKSGTPKVKRFLTSRCDL